MFQNWFINQFWKYFFQQIVLLQELLFSSKFEAKYIDEFRSPKVGDKDDVSEGRNDDSFDSKILQQFMKVD